MDNLDEYLAEEQEHFAGTDYTTEEINSLLREVIGNEEVTDSETL